MKQDDVSNCHCLRVRRLSRIVTAIYDRELAPTGLRVTQFTVLSAVAALQPSGANAGQIAEALDLDASSLSRALATLRSTGFVTLTSGPHRGRRFAVTERGAQKLCEARPYWETAQSKVQAALTAEGAAHVGRMVSATRPLAGDNRE